MHEISLVRQIFRTLEQSMPIEERRRIQEIHLQVGLLSNVEPQLLQNAFTAVVATEAPDYQDARLEIEVIPIEVLCPECGSQTIVEHYRFVCSCGKPTNNVVKGMELLIQGVKLADGVSR
ncbi:MAG: hydrogenase maturation nickel metallochaperone HypA [Lewinellaceae bacterium]|nr:hydrogenase maturation nickel metallochaperone HypA [Lewinellaceae bacterium]